METRSVQIMLEPISSSPTRELLPLPSRENSVAWTLDSEPSEVASVLSDGKAPSKMEAAAARMELRAKKSMRIRKSNKDALLLAEENSRDSLAGESPANMDSAPTREPIKEQENETNVKYMLASNLHHGVRVDFVSRMNNAAKVIQREWRARKKRRYWEAVDNALGRGEGMMQRNAWGGFTMINDPFAAVEEEEKENLCLIEEYYSGSEYDELSGSDDDMLEVLEADLETAAAELADCGEEEMSLEEVKKAAMKYARKRKRLKIKEKLLAAGLLPADPEKRKKPPRKALRHMKKEEENKKKEARSSKLLGGGKSRRKSLDAPRPKTQEQQQQQNRRKSMDEPRARSPKPDKSNPPSPASPEKSPLRLPNVIRRPFKPKPPPLDPIPGNWSRPVLDSSPEEKPPHDFLRRHGGVERPRASIKAKLEGEKESKDVVAQLKDEIHELKAEIKRLAPNQVKPFKVAEFDNWTTLMKWRFALLTHTVLQLKGLTKQKDKVFDKATQAKLTEWANQSPVEALEEVAAEVHRSAGGAVSRRRLLRKFDMLAITRAVAKFHTWLGNLEDLLVIGTKPGTDTPVSSPVASRVMPGPSHSERRAQRYTKRMLTGFEDTERLRTPRVGAIRGCSVLPSQPATPSISTATRDPPHRLSDLRGSDEATVRALENKIESWKLGHNTPRLPAMGTHRIQRRPHSMEQHVRETRKVDWQKNKAKFYRFGPRPPPRLIVTSDSSDMLPVAFAPFQTAPAILPSRQSQLFSRERRSFDGTTSRSERRRAMRSSM